MGVSGFRIDPRLPDEAAKRRLDMPARAAKAVVKVEMAERRVEVIAREPVDHPLTQPAAFRIAGRTDRRLGCIGRLLSFLGTVLRLIGRSFGFGLFSRFGVAALGGRGDHAEDQGRGQGGGGIKTQYTVAHRNPKSRVQVPGSAIQGRDV